MKQIRHEISFMCDACGALELIPGNNINTSIVPDGWRTVSISTHSPDLIEAETVHICKDCLGLPDDLPSKPLRHRTIVIKGQLRRLFVAGINSMARAEQHKAD